MMTRKKSSKQRLISNIEDTITALRSGDEVNEYVLDLEGEDTIEEDVVEAMAGYEESDDPVEDSDFDEDYFEEDDDILPSMSKRVKSEPDRRLLVNHRNSRGRKLLRIKAIAVNPYLVVRRRVELTPSMCKVAGCNFDAATANGYKSYWRIDPSRRDIFKTVLKKHMRKYHNYSEDHIILANKLPGEWLHKG